MYTMTATICGSDVSAKSDKLNHKGPDTEPRAALISRHVRLVKRMSGIVPSLIIMAQVVVMVPLTAI